MATLEESFLADLAELSDDGGGEEDQVHADGDDIEVCSGLTGCEGDAFCHKSARTSSMPRNFRRAQ